MEKKEIVAIVNDMSLSKSERMRRLYNGGLEIKEIKGYMGVSYNYVYNVVSGMCVKRGEVVRVEGKKGEKRDLIIKYYEEGLRVKEIMYKMGNSEGYIRKVIKEYRERGVKKEIADVEVLIEKLNM